MTFTGDTMLDNNQSLLWCFMYYSLMTEFQDLFPINWDVLLDIGFTRTVLSLCEYDASLTLQVNVSG